MALKDDVKFGQLLAQAASLGNPVLAELNLPQWLAVAAVINAQIRGADVDPTAGTPAMNVAAAPGAVAGYGKLT